MKKETMLNIAKEIIPYAIILIVVILIRTFLVTPIRVNGPSMDTTLKDGEIMILNKLGKPEKGKIVVVNIESDKIIKRVIATPGDSVYCKDGVVYVNDKALKENYTSSDTADFKKVYLKDDEYFVMGDNRKVSMDSRTFGPVNKKQILGTTNLILFPISKKGKAK